MKNIKVLSAVGLISLASSAAMAASGPTLGSLFDASGIQVNGAVAGSFRQNLSVPNPDQAKNAAQVDQALLSINYLPKQGFGAAVDVASGDYNDQSGNVGNPASGTKLSQAYLQYKSGSLTVQGGRFYTAAGYEVFPVVGNLFVSRSATFTGSTVAGAEFKGESSYHTGLRATYAKSEALSLVLGVNDGIYDNLDNQPSVSKDKAIELGLNWKATSDISLNLSVNNGKTGPGGQRQSLYSLVATYSLSKDINFALNYDRGNYDNTESGKWTAVALYGMYDLSDKVKLGVRLENVTQRLESKKGTGGVAGVVSYAAAKNLDIRTEVSDVDVEGPTPRKMQAAVQGVLKF